MFQLIVLVAPTEYILIIQMSLMLTVTWRQMMVTGLDRIICLLCVYICHYIFPFYYLDIFSFFFDSVCHKIKN